MKEVKAVINQFKLDNVLSALHDIGGLPSVAISSIEAVDTTPDRFVAAPRTRIELMVPDGLVEIVVEAIRAAAHTGNPGDGRIFIIPIEETVLIRTGERGHSPR